MPISWTQARTGLDPGRFTLRTVPALVGKLKAWEEYNEGARGFFSAAKKLVGKRGR